MKNKLSKSKLFFILASLVFVVYFFASLPYGFGNNTNAISGNWLEVDVSNLTLSPVDGVCYINTEEDLGKMLQLINSGTSYKGTNYNALNYVLTANIDLNKNSQGHYWTPIKEFRGTFDGNGFAISNMWIKYDASDSNVDAGFFSNIVGGSVKNVIFKNCGISVDCIPAHSIGILAGAISNGVIENCKIVIDNEINKYNSNITSFKTTTTHKQDMLFGGIAGWVSNSTIKQCKVEDSRNNSSTFDFNPYFSNKLINSCYIGGLVGMMENGGKITLCSTNAKITGIHRVATVNVGGIAGIIDSAVIEKCENNGNVSAGDAGNTINANVGGIVGWAKVKETISYCYNTGDIFAYAKEQSTNKEKLPAFTSFETGPWVGFGFLYDVVLDYQYHYTYTRRANAGGIAGRASKETTIKYCYNAGIIEGYTANGENDHVDFDVDGYYHFCWVSGSATVSKKIIGGQIVGWSEGGEAEYNYSKDKNDVEMSYSIKAASDNDLAAYGQGEPVEGSETITKKIERTNCDGDSDIEIEVELSSFDVEKNSYSYEIKLKDGTDADADIEYTLTSSGCKIDEIKTIEPTSNNIEDICTSSSEVYTQDANINGGLPFIKELYWQYLQQEPPSYSFEWSFNESNETAILTKANITGNLKDIEIPETIESNGKTYTVTEIGCLGTGQDAVGAFQNTTSLINVKLPNTVSTIGSRAFKGCSSLESINLRFVKHLQWESFGNCYKLNNVNLTNLITLGNTAFWGCALEKVTLPLTITRIGDWAFTYCNKLTSINLPLNLTVIGAGAFRYCSNLKTIKFPNSLTSIGNSAFEGSGLSGNLNLNNNGAMNGLKTIGSYAFKGCTSITWGTIYDGVTSVGEGAFEGCSSLAQINWPKLTTTIANNTFKNCSKLKKTVYWYNKDGVDWKDGLPDTVTSIGASAFEDSGLSGNLNLNNNGAMNGLKTIGSYAFKGCTALTIGTINDGVTTIGEGAFEGCSSLAQINWPKSTTTIANNTFKNCKKLEKIVYWYGKNGVDWKDGLPYTVTSICAGAFYGCTQFSVTGLSSIKTIGDYAFYNCFNTGSTVYILNLENVETIGNSAFAGCKYLNISGLNKIETIGDNAFKGCDNLRGTFDDKLGKNVLELSASLNELGSNSFQNCEKLMYIKFNGTYDKWKKLNGTHKDGNAGDKANINNACILRCENGVDYYTEYKLNFSLFGYYWSSIGDVRIN